MCGKNCWWQGAGIGKRWRSEASWEAAIVVQVSEALARRKG